MAGFLDRFFGGTPNPTQDELISLLGGDPRAMRANARRNGMLQLGASLLSADGANGVQKTGRALAQFGLSGRGMAPEMEQLVQAFNLRQQIKDMKTAAERRDALAKMANDPATWAGIPEDSRAAAQMLAQGGDFSLLEKILAEKAKYHAPTALSGGAFMQRAAAQLGFDPNDASTIPADRLPEIAKLAQQMSLERGKAGAGQSPDISKILQVALDATSKAEGKGAGEAAATVNEQARAANELANSMDVFTTLREQGTGAMMPTWQSLVQGSRTIPGLRGYVERQYDDKGKPGSGAAKLDATDLARKATSEMTLSKIKLLGANPSNSDLKFAVGSHVGIDTPLEEVQMQQQVLRLYADRAAQVAREVNAELTQSGQQLAPSQVQQLVNDRINSLPSIVEQLRARLGARQQQTATVPSDIDALMAKYGKR